VIFIFALDRHWVYEPFIFYTFFLFSPVYRQTAWTTKVWTKCFAQKN